MNVIDLTYEQDSVIEVSNDDVILMSEEQSPLSTVPVCEPTTLVSHTVSVGGFSTASSTNTASSSSSSPLAQMTARLDVLRERLHSLTAAVEAPRDASSPFVPVFTVQRLVRRLSALRSEASLVLTSSSHRRFLHALRPLSADVDHLVQLVSVRRRRVDSQQQQQQQQQDTAPSPLPDAASTVPDPPAAVSSSSVEARRRTARRSAVSQPLSLATPTRASGDPDGVVECAVCLTSVVELRRERRELRVLRCGHWFCAVCTARSLSATHRCPVCRCNISRPSHHHKLFL